MEKASRDKGTGRFVLGKNTFFIDEDGIVFVYKNGSLLFFTDDKRVIDRVWCPMADGYSATRMNGKEVLAHRFLMNPPSDMLVDHINCNKQDNRLCNLRLATKSQNAYNSKPRTTNKSGVVGVRLRKDTGKWTATIRNNYKTISLGCFEKKEDAVRARKEAEKTYMGDFAYGKNE